MDLDRKAWLARFRTELARQRPSFDEAMLDELTTLEAHEALSMQFPDDPEAAARYAAQD